MKKDKTFNLIIIGYGGQGVLTIAEIIARAALFEEYQVKQAELHGLSQRGGLLECHLRFGKEVFSPLVRKAGADLVISLDLLDAFSSCYYAYKKRTVILTNSQIFTPYPFEEKRIVPQKIISQIKKFAKKLIIFPASEKIKKLTKETAMINTLILGYAIAKKLLPIKKKSILQAMEEKIRPQFLKENKKIFELAFK